MASFPHKRGDTFLKTCLLREDDQTTPIDITGWCIQGHVRDEMGVLFASIQVTVTDAPNGAYTIEVPPEITELWPPDERLLADIEYTDAVGVVRSTDTFYIPVLQDITYGVVCGEEA